MNEEGEKTYRSRKWFLTLLIFTISTIGTFVPPMVGAWVFGETKPLVILSGTEWVSLISMVAAAYIGGNVWQKREEMKANVAMVKAKTIQPNEDGEA